jgi:hypothetical protein
VVVGLEGHVGRNSFVKTLACAVALVTMCAVVVNVADAAVPSVFASGVVSASPRTSVISGSVAGGATDGVSSYSAGYGLASTRWCRTDKGRPASWTPVHRTHVGRGERRDVAIRITGLMTGRLYCAAIYINGRSTGSVMLEFTAGAPGAEPRPGGNAQPNQRAALRDSQPGAALDELPLPVGRAPEPVV